MSLHGSVHRNFIQYNLTVSYNLKNANPLFFTHVVAVLRLYDLFFSPKHLKMYFILIIMAVNLKKGCKRLIKYSFATRALRHGFSEVNTSVKAVSCQNDSLQIWPRKLILKMGANAALVNSNRGASVEVKIFAK